MWDSLLLVIGFRLVNVLFEIEVKVIRVFNFFSDIMFFLVRCWCVEWNWEFRNLMEMKK